MAIEQQAQQRAGDGSVATESEDKLTITDKRTGQTYELEVTDGTIRAMDLRQIKVSEDDFGLMAYDPAFTNTASPSMKVIAERQEAVLVNAGS